LREKNRPGGVGTFAAGSRNISDVSFRREIAAVLLSGLAEGKQLHTFT